MIADMEAEARLSRDWELWVVEQLLFEAKRDDLVEVLVDRGVTADAAREQVAALERSEGFRRLKARLSEATLAARLQRLLGEVSPGDVLAERDTIDAETLLRDHWIASRPLKLTAPCRDLQALDWTFAGLAARFGHVPVNVNVARAEAFRACETEQHLRTVRFGALVDLAMGPAGNDAYAVSRCGLLAADGLRPLWDDLTPLPPFLVPPTPPRGVSLWLGPAGTVTPPHFDPHNVLLVQVAGRKQVRMAPRLRAALHDQLDGYYLRGTLDAVFGDSVCTTELGPGEALFIPVGWFHEVTAQSPSMTLSFVCFAWPNHFHFLGPPGSDDAR